MFTVRRWWERYGSQFVLTGLVLAIALLIRQTQGGPIAELYYNAVQPFQSGPKPEERWANARVSELQTRLTELEKQNEQLKKLLDYTKTQKKQSITAPIIGRSVDHWWAQVMLGRGSKDGVKEGYIVSGPGGLVGRVVKVTPHTSRVLLISDPSSKVGVAIAQTRYMGFLRGEKEESAVMEFFDKVPEVKVGDTVVTSAASRLFPPGIPIGTVKEADLEKSPAPEVKVKLTAPINYLEWVVIHPFEQKS